MIGGAVIGGGEAVGEGMFTNPTAHKEIRDASL